MSTGSYSFTNDILFSINSLPMSGYGDGDDVIICTPKQDIVTSRAGADGHVTRAVNGDRRWDIVVKLMDTSSANSLIQTLVDGQFLGAGTFPILLKDAGGTDSFFAQHAWVSKQTAAQYGQGANLREWALEANDVTAFFGGHLT